jgi:hypothetical protein
MIGKRLNQYMREEVTLNDGTVVTRYKLAGMKFARDY